MRIRTAGRHALLLEWTVAARADIETWRAELHHRRDRGDLDAVEIVPAARTILLDGLSDPAATARQLARWQPRNGRHRNGPPGASPAAGSVPGRLSPLVTVPVQFDGPDLTAVAEHWGVDPATAVDRLTGADLQVAFCGFAPGFAYLSGLPAEWAVPRRSSPRPAVPAGAVALAGEYAGIYPSASPGGWQLVGRTDLVLFDLDRDPPATLVPGTRVRLAHADRSARDRSGCDRSGR
ncbi:5-oxoprolinase subunit B family protein [Solwaraspora sp. WMMB335]|uniref:5-oxoprolinase subunit B family protein n=1 Tax=Solwaraspora sp. WMMB335 TaxID=3404118 RepID=UPI003B927FED